MSALESRRRRRRATGVAALVLWLVIMAPLALWGLPSARHDELLFGGSPPWQPDRYGIAADVEALRRRSTGADTDLNPIIQRDHLINLTPNEAARGEILRRYRLYSRQPDEMITLRALQRMNPRRLDFDPRLYQYGGAYIYLVGATLLAASVAGLLHLTADVTYYLARPEAFAGFYVAARSLSLLAGALTLVAVFRLATRAAGRRAGWLAAILTAAAPVFITATLEAKPHLPSAALILWAMLAALDVLRNRRTRDFVRLALSAGGAFAFVLTGLAALLLFLPLALYRRIPRRTIAWAGGLALGVYAAANPYLVWHAAQGGPALESNLANSLAMYRDEIARAPAGALRVAQLLPEATGALTAIVGLVGGVLLMVGSRPVAAVAPPALALLALATLLGAGKPAEFARFLLLPAIVLCVCAAAAVMLLARRRPVLAFALVVALLGTTKTPTYLSAFAADAAGEHESRRAAGHFLRGVLPDVGARVGVLQEPAPYAVPPLDFTRAEIILLPRERPAGLEPAALPEWIVFTADDAAARARDWWIDAGAYRLVAQFPPREPPARIAWANKPVFVYRRAP